MQSSFLTVQSKIEQQNFNSDLSGSTVVGCYQRENQIIFANCGDSRAILIGETVENHNQEYEERGGSDLGDSIVIMATTRDQKPDQPDEADRILNHYDG